MIENHIKLSIFFEHSIGFFKALLHIGRMMKHSIRVNDIVCMIGKREIFSIT